MLHLIKFLTKPRQNHLLLLVRIVPIVLLQKRPINISRLLIMPWISLATIHSLRLQGGKKQIGLSDRLACRCAKDCLILLTQAIGYHP